MTETNINTADNAVFFQLTLLGFAIYAILYFFTAFSQGVIRKRIFNKEFMSQFNEEHQAAFGGNDAPVGGLPDDGNGYYAAKLSYGDWFTFNNWQRAHMNFLETIMPVAVMTFITSINQPLWSCISIYVLIAGRVMYAIGYCKGGPKGRVVGAIVTDLGLLAVLVGGFYSIFTWDLTEGAGRMLPISQDKLTALTMAAVSA